MATPCGLPRASASTAKRESELRTCVINLLTRSASTGFALGNPSRFSKTVLKRISHSSSWPTSLNFRSDSLSAEETNAWRILADAEWRELRRPDLSRQGVGCFDWR